MKASPLTWMDLYRGPRDKQIAIFDLKNIFFFAGVNLFLFLVIKTLDLDQRRPKMLDSDPHWFQSVWRIRDVPDPDFYPSRIPDLGSRIPDPKTATKERGEKKFVVIIFYVATNFTKLQIILVLKC
jgi:hypothetical protein